MGNGFSDSNACHRAEEKARDVPMVNLDKVRRTSSSATVACRYHLKKERSIHEDYEVSSEVLGQGLCGDVVVARGRADGKRYAVKTLRKEGISETKLLQHISEVEIHLAMDHPNIAHVKDVYESETSISMVTECCEGGELYASLQEKSVYSNEEALEITHQMMRVVSHLHARSIVHRDLKLENFLYQCRDPHAQMEQFLQARHQDDDSSQIEVPQLKLIDFGFARVWDPARLMRTACGSAEYVSPDVLSGQGYTKQTDLWSLGVIVWMLLTGYPPFHGEKNVMMSNIKAAKADWSHQSRWKNVCQDAKDFVSKLLMKDPSERMDVQAALAHPWLNSRSQCDFLPSAKLVWSMQSYAAGAKLRRAALQIIVQQLDFNDMRKFRSDFFRLHRDCEGWLSLQDLRDLMDELERSSNESLFHAGDYDRPEVLFAALDSNGDGRIYFTEFMAATIQLSQQHHKRALKAAFARLDADADGSIGEDDLKATLGDEFECTSITELLRDVCLNGTLGAKITYQDFVDTAVQQVSIEEVGAISPSKCSVGPMSPMEATKIEI